MGGRLAGVSGWGLVWCALITSTCAKPAWAETRSQLSEPVSLYDGALDKAPLPVSLACTAHECAAFYVDSDANGRVAGVLLDAAGAPIESTRVDFGRSNGGLRVVAADAGFVLAISDPAVEFGLRVLLLDAKTLNVKGGFANIDCGRTVRGLYSNGKTALLLDFTTSDVATMVDLETSTLIGQQAIDDFWEPVVIPGPDQYLLFYPSYGDFARLSSTTGTWLGSGGLITPAPSKASEGSGYFRDGVYQLIWRATDAQTGVATPQLLGLRVNAADGKPIDVDVGKPAPRLLCNECRGGLQGSFQTGAANYFWLAPGNGYALLRMDPTTGLRGDPTLNGPDVISSDAPAVDALSPIVEPRLLTSKGAVYVANPQDVAKFLAGEPMLPGKTSGLTPGGLRAASNGKTFVVVWNVAQRAYAAFVWPKPKPALGISAVSVRELGFPELTEFKVASAGGQFLIAGLHENDDHRLDLLWRMMDDTGQLGPLNTESTGAVLTGLGIPSMALGSDGEHYLLAFCVASLGSNDGTIFAQRLSAWGAIQEPLAEVAQGVVLLDGVDANFAAPEAARHFGVTYRVYSGDGLVSNLRRTPATGPLAFETIALSPYQYVLANNGRSLLFGGAALLDLAGDPPRLRGVPSADLSGLSHWDGNAYVRLANAGPVLTVNEVSPTSFKLDGQELQVTRELVSYSPVAAADGKGRSLLAYFASESPNYTVALRGTLLETERDAVNGEGGEGGEGGAGGEGGDFADGGVDGKGAIRDRPENGAGAKNGAGSSGIGSAGIDGSAAIDGSAGESDGGASHGDGGSASRNTDGDRRSRACGCTVPGVGPANSGLTLLLLAACALRRKRR